MGALRILHVAPYFEHAWAYGGIPRVVSAQAHALAAAGHHVTVATTDARDGKTRTSAAGGETSRRLSPRRERTADGIDVLVFPNLSNAAAYRWQFFMPIGFTGWLGAHAREFDVAHLHACHNLLTARGATILRRAGVPYVVQPNGTARRIERRRAAKWVFDALFGADCCGMRHASSPCRAASAGKSRSFGTPGLPSTRNRMIRSLRAGKPRGSYRIRSRRCRRAACRSAAGSANASASRTGRC